MGQKPEPSKSLKDVYKRWKEKCVNPEFDKIKNYYMQEIFDHEKDIDIFDIAGEKDDVAYERRIAIHLKKVIVKAALLYHCVNDGLTFCDGREINYESKSKTDCLLFWYQIQPSELILNVLNANNFPLCMRNSTIVNDADPSDKMVVDELDVDLEKDRLKNKMRELYTEAQDLEL